MPTLTPIPVRQNGRQIERPRTPSRPSTSSSSKENEASSKNSAPLADYTLGDCLGKGAFGSVYRALNWGTGETVAVKQVRLADLPKSELRVIMLEIDLLKNLNHPNIVQYHGFVKTTDSLYIILEYCENGSLHSICKNFGKFPENLVGLYMTQVLHGLLYLHDQGVIHRDIKGANILTTKEGLVKLADFGVATRTTGLSDSSVVGTPYWMAPEVIELAGATTSSDIWSVGCTVVELLDGKPPYHKLASMQALFRIVNDDHPPLPEGASPAVRDFLMQCFQKDPNLRVSARKLLKHPWIVNAKRSDSVVRTPTTKYDEAVKSVQQWNAALQSPNAPKTTRPSVLSPNPPRRTHVYSLEPGKGPLALRSRPTEAFMSPENTLEDDNWDDDFGSVISAAALQFPRNKIADGNIAGLQSFDRLKSFASNDGTDENWGDDFEGDITIKSPPIMDFEADPMQTIRPYFPRRQSEPSLPSDDISTTMIPITEPPPLPTTPTKSKPRKLMLPFRNTSRHPSVFREDAFEDYSDLAPVNEATFARKVDLMKKDASLSPRLFHPSDLKSLPRSTNSSQHGSLRRQISLALGDTETQAHAIRRSRSSMEIQRFAEPEGEDDYSDIFGSEGGTDEAGSETSGDDHSLLLNTKLSNNSWLGDEEPDEDDPFAQLEEGFDEMDLEANIARDKYARLCIQVEALVGSLKETQSEEDLDDISSQLMDVLLESPETRNTIIGAHGMLPILEVLETCKKREVILKLLKIVNAIIFDDVEIQENLCFVGGIPIITKFASKKYPGHIRLEAAAFVRQMYQTSTLTLQMFVSCGGLNVLVEFLEEDYDAQKDLVLIGVNGIWSVFEMQGPTPKNDFCRIFSRSSVLHPLSLVLCHVLDEDGELSDLCVERIVNIFYLFSQAENHVKEMVADRIVLKRVLKDLKRMAPSHQVVMLKFIKNLSMLSSTLDTLQNSNAIEVLTDLLTASMNVSHFKEISNQVLNTMFNLCRLSKSRQEEAALHGIIPLLQRIVSTERPLKEFALPILCDMAHSGKVCRKILWQNKGLQFYISLLSDPYWQVTALDAIFVWLQEETARVEERLLGESFTTAIINCFTTSKTNAFENILDPLQKLMRLSLPIAHAVGQPEFFARILSKLSHHKALVRLNLLRILRTICDASEQKEALIRIHGMYSTIYRLAQKDNAVLVSNLAGELIKMCAEREKEKRVSYRSRGHRSISSSTSSSFSMRERALSSSSQRGNVSSLWGYDVNGIVAGDEIDMNHLPLSSGNSAGRVVQEKKKVLRRTPQSSGLRTSNKYIPRRSRGPPTTETPEWD
ncbi:uncharacterized protein H6S33_009547 [Morchella sextelata]|uniref:uncharacterized protein n=1 Tax=Morchella sextelata TaxID=1174677 RepID=UPI001D05379B|nr:uncharacterized protein H6S33_009547 [Morchella sextelata]KAH0613167.1 hypothetical protein H6S33_009547 [Morchella sextelata]